MSTLTHATVASSLTFPGRDREIRHTMASLRKLRDRIGAGSERAEQPSPVAPESMQSITDRVAERVERDLDDPDSTLFLIFERMMATERAHHLGEDAFWRLEDAPIEYRLLNMQWNAEVRRIMSRVLTEMLGDIAGSEE